MSENPTPKLTPVEPSAWSPWDGKSAGVSHLVQVGPRILTGYHTSKGKPLGMRDVYLDGELIGHVAQTERTRDRKPAGRTYVTTRTEAVEWQWTGLDGRGSHRLTEKQMNDAVYQLAGDVFEKRQRTSGGDNRP